jgi:superfamily II DNA or RNA helicase
LKFTVTVKATCITITPGKEACDVLEPLINLHTYEDEFQDETKVLGFMYDEKYDTLYFHKGISLEYVKRLLINVKIITDYFSPYREMQYDFEEFLPPRDDDQKDYINFLAGVNNHIDTANLSQVFLVASGGKGKEESYSRKIPTPTPDGYTLMGDLQIGDYVFSRDGSKTKVIGIFEQGEKDVYRITFQDGRYALCGLQHLWQVYKDGKYEKILTTEELMKVYKRPNNNHLYERKKNWDDFDYPYSIPINGVVEYPYQPTPVDPWVFGCFVGNGCCLEPNLTISSPNDIIPKRIADICGFKVKKQSIHNYNYTFYHANGKPVKTNELFGLSIGGHGSNTKKIPQEYLINSPEMRLKLLQGLMDTDGSIDADIRFHVNYSSTSYRLLKQIQWLLYSFGWSGCLTFDKRGKEKYRNGFCASLVFRMPNQCKQQLFTVPYKLERAKLAAERPQKDFYSRLIIKDIRFDHREQCRCIMVDNPEHLYLTENFIVTHNTFCTGYAIGLFGAKALIIMHRDTLRGQWSKSLYDLNGFPRDRVHEITSSEEFESICYNRHNFDYDIYLMTHATFKAGVKRVGDTKLVSDFTRNLGIGVKVIDEAHLEFKDTLLMDFLFNVRRNIYLTATDGRSQRSENTIFKHVFSNATFYKKKEEHGNHPDKWVEYITIQVNTHVPISIYRYRVNGGKGMSAVSYGKWVIQRDKKQTHFKVCKELLREIYTNEPTAKVIVFMPLIELCNECALFLNDLNYDESFKYDLTIRTINSHNTKAVNETNKGADVIVTTIQSLGTGLDIKGITDIICCSPFVSKITAQQVFWRIRYIDKKCHYYDIIDTSVQTDIFWWRSRSKMLKSMATKYIQLTWEDDDDGSNQSS